ncbi:hypothetical protein H4N58_05285 [Mumia sp. ZJ1417]|uniref:hypothetical protein n=1 Tax=Mumia sp. ZJ1417 TaxID=2708082 RepID=UPI001422E3A1|nr:hypothetical protein [Mumia sp. ZJ1417]QMW67325.1 hypothetical protein H4N58_05285 [Mumia sp. ZJ1417]
MKPLLRPGTTVVRRTVHTLQVGTLPGSTILVDDLPGSATVLRLADGTRDLPTLAAVAGRPLPEIADAVRRLRACGAVVDAQEWDEIGGEALTTEARALVAANAPANDVVRRLHARGASSVEIVTDVPGRPLAARLHRILHESGLRATIGPVADPDLVVVLSSGPCPREAFDVLAGAGVAHLPVVTECDTARIGPLVRPGSSPCVRCDDLDRTGGEPGWLLVLEQLGQPLARSTPLHPHGWDAASGYALALHVATQVLAYADRVQAAAEGAVAVVSARGGAPTYHPVALHPDCACQILASETSGADGSGGVARGVRMTA